MDTLYLGKQCEAWNEEACIPLIRRSVMQARRKAHKGRCATTCETQIRKIFQVSRWKMVLALAMRCFGDFRVARRTLEKWTCCGSLCATLKYIVGWRCNAWLYFPLVLILGTDWCNGGSLKVSAKMHLLLARTTWKAYDF